MPQLRPRVFAKKKEEPVTPIDSPPVTSIAESYQPAAPEEFRDEMPLLSIKDAVDVEEKALVPVTIRIPKLIYEDYQKIAAAQDITLEEVIQYRVAACKNHNALRGLWFSDLERGQLENLIQKWPLESATQVLNLISRAAIVRFDDMQVVLTPAQKKVLVTRFGGRTPQSFFESLIKRELRT